MLAASENKADCKSLAATENQADGRILAAAENQADGKILAAKIKRMVKSFRPEKIRRTIESLRALKSPHLVINPRLWKYWRDWKSKRPTCCLGSAESPTANFSLVPLMTTFSSSFMWWISHVVSKWGGSYCCPAFMGGLSPVLYWLFVLARHAKKWPKSTRQPKV